MSGQNTSVALLLVVGVAAALQAGRPVLAGILGGLLALQAAAGRADRPDARLAWPSAGGRRGGLVVDREYLLGVLAAGGDWGWPRDLVDLAADYNPLDLAANGWQAVSLPALLGRLTPGDAAPGSFTGPALVGYVVAALIVLRCLPALRRWSPARAIALACAAGLVDQPPRLGLRRDAAPAGAGRVRRRRARRGWPWQDRWLMAAAYAIARDLAARRAVGKVGVLLVLVVTLAPFALQGWWPFRWARPQATG